MLPLSILVIIKISMKRVILFTVMPPRHFLYMVDYNRYKKSL